MGNSNESQLKTVLPAWLAGSAAIAAITLVLGAASESAESWLRIAALPFIAGPAWALSVPGFRRLEAVSPRDPLGLLTLAVVAGAALSCWLATATATGGRGLWGLAGVMLGVACILSVVSLVSTVMTTGMSFRRTTAERRVWRNLALASAAALVGAFGIYRLRAAGASGEFWPTGAEWVAWCVAATGFAAAIAGGMYVRYRAVTDRTTGAPSA